MGPGGLSPAAPPTVCDAGSEPGGGGARTAPKFPPAHRLPCGPGCLSLPLNIPPPRSVSEPPYRGTHSALTPQGPGDPASPHPHPGPARPGAVGVLATAVPQLATGPLPEAVSAAGRRHEPRPEAGGRRQATEASGKPGGGRQRRAERAAVAGSAPAPYTALAAEPAAPAPG